MDRNGFEDLPDSAMDTGSDAGEPGEHLGPEDLRPDEQRLLEELVGTAPGEDDDLVAEAAEDDRPLPDEGGGQDDGLSPRFSNPD